MQDPLYLACPPMQYQYQQHYTTNTTLINMVLSSSTSNNNNFGSPTGYFFSLLVILKFLQTYNTSVIIFINIMDCGIAQQQAQYEQQIHISAQQLPAQQSTLQYIYTRVHFNLLYTNTAQCKTSRLQQALPYITITLINNNITKHRLNSDLPP